MMASARSRVAERVYGILRDALYRGSLVLLLDSVAVAVLGFIFWTLAARTYSATAVGIFAGMTAGVSLLATIAALGLPAVIIRHLSKAPDARRLVILSVVAIAIVGGVLCLFTVIILGPHLPVSLHLGQRGGVALLVTALVIISAVNGAVNAGLVAARATHIILLETVASGIVKIIAIILLAGFGSAGLLLAYGLALLFASGLGGLGLRRHLRASVRSHPMELLRRYVKMTAGNYLATILGILPATIVPLLVLAALGSAVTARFTVAFLIASVLNFIPSAAGQVLFAEASRPGQSPTVQLVKALRLVYGLLLPPIIVVVTAAPLILTLFGPAYADAATDCLRVLTLSALFTGGTYLVDAVLIASDRMPAYIFMNGANAALVLGCVAALLPHGLTGAASGWAIAQGLSLLLGAIVVLSPAVVGRKPQVRQPGRHRAGIHNARL
jgi:O-antigen/teichoic acid export membrane protein